MRRILNISHETIYRYIWKDRHEGGDWYTHLRQSPKQRRKRYGTYERRGVMAGKRPIEDSLQGLSIAAE